MKARRDGIRGIRWAGWRRWLAGWTLALLLGGCGAAGQDITPSLVVSAAADLTPAFTEVGEAFTRETGIAVTVNFGATGQLAQQIAQGAPADVFAAADQSYIDELAAAGRVLPDSVAVYAQGRLTLWTRADSTLMLERIEDLAGPGITRIALANPEHAPYGRAARTALQAAGLWEALQPRLVFGENVAQALQFAQTGNVDAALIALSLSAAAGEAGRYALVADGLYEPLNQALAVVSSTRHEAEARQFAAFVTGPEGRAILERYGFTYPEVVARP